MDANIERSRKLMDAHFDEAREIIRAEVERIAKIVVKQAVADIISSGALFQNSTAIAHPKYQPQPKRPRA